MRPFLYLIGPSGAGKTTCLAAALEPVKGSVIGKPFAHTIYASGAIQLGKMRAPFGGTDALPMDAITRVEPWLRQTGAPAVIAEGDRLANDRFFKAVIEAGWELTVVYLAVSSEKAHERRDQRGSAYSQDWAKGRHTKANNLACKWVAPAWWLDGHESVESIAERLRAHPAIQIARGSA